MKNLSIGTLLFLALSIVLPFQNCTSEFRAIGHSDIRAEQQAIEQSVRSIAVPNPPTPADSSVAQTPSSGHSSPSGPSTPSASTNPKTEPVQAPVLNRNVASINMQDYFPKDMRVSTDFYNLYGYKTANYSFYPGNANFKTVYDAYQSLHKPGSLLIWQKNIFSAGAPAGGCLATYGMLWLGATDKSITEVGDWLAMDKCGGQFGAFSYREPLNPRRNSGIVWSDIDGLTPKGTFRDYLTAINGQIMTGYQAFNWTGLMGVYDSYTVPYGVDATGKLVAGAGKTYQNVALIYFLHGVKGPGQKEIRCFPDKTWEGSALYTHVEGYSSYASLYLLAPGKGIIQEFFLFNETDSYFGPELNCRGYALGQTKEANVNGGNLLNPYLFILYGDPK